MESNISNSTIRDFYNSERDMFIKDIEKFFTHCKTRISLLLNHKEKIEFPKLMDSNDFQSDIKFLEEINNIYEKNKDSIEDKKPDILYEDSNDELWNFSGAEVKREDLDVSWISQKYTSGGKMQNINNNDNNNIESTHNRFIINYKLAKFYEIYFNGKKHLIEKFEFVDKDFDIYFDFVIQNIMREEKGNNLPNGWIGLGLNVSKLYEEDGEWLFNKKKTNQWIDGYIGIVRNLEYLTSDLTSEIDIKKDKNDKIHNFAFNSVKFKEYAKKENIKFYVYSNIESAKNEPKTIDIGKIKYKFLLNVKVKKDEISQQINKKIWYLDAKFIRVYRILFQ